MSPAQASRGRLRFVHLPSTAFLTTDDLTYVARRYLIFNDTSAPDLNDKEKDGKDKEKKTEKKDPEPEPKQKEEKKEGEKSADAKKDGDTDAKEK